MREHPIRGANHVDFFGESEGSLPPLQDSLPNAGEAINDFWSMSENFKIRHHVEPRVKLHSPREESFPIPLKYIDVSRTTHTNLDVKQERHIDDYWNIDGTRVLTDSWTDFTQFTPLEEKPPDGYMWSGRRLTRKQLTSRPDHLWSELWEKMGKNVKRKERQKSSHEIPQSDNARKLRGIFSMTLRTRNSKRPSRMLARNWKHRWLPLCLAGSKRTIRIAISGGTHNNSNESPHMSDVQRRHDRTVKCGWEERAGWWMKEITVMVVFPDTDGACNSNGFETSPKDLRRPSSQPHSCQTTDPLITPLRSQ